MLSIKTLYLYEKVDALEKDINVMTFTVSDVDLYKFSIV